MFRRIATLTLSLAIAASVSAVPVSAANDFADVPVTHKYYESVAFCRDRQIVAGVGNNFFAPDAPLTGFQFCTMLCRAYFPDEVIENPVMRCYEEDWVDMSVLLDPDCEMSFHSVFDVLLRIEGIPNYYYDSIESAIRAGMIEASDVPDVFAFVTRAQATYYLQNSVVRDYELAMPELFTYLNTEVEEGYGDVAGASRPYLEMLPQEVLDAWHDSGYKLIFGYHDIAEYIAENGGASITGLYSTGRLTIASYLSTIHEFGHFVYRENHLESAFDPFYSQYRDVIGAGVSEYATTNASEFFAEVFELYILKSNRGQTLEHMQELLPDVYAFMVRLDENGWSL